MTHKKHLVIDDKIEKEINRHLDRSGWFSLVVIVGLLLVFLYIFLTFFQSPNRKQFNQYSEAQHQMQLQIESLQSELSSLKDEVSALKDQE